MPKKNSIDEQSVLELEQAKHFMQWVIRHKPSRIKGLDKKKDRKRPEFAFYYGSGQQYTLELKRWLPPELRELQNFLEKNVAQPLGNILKGTFVLNVPFEKLRGGRITQNEAQNLVSQIRQIVNSALNGQTYPLSTGAVSKVDNDGHRLVPMITQPELPLYLDENSQEAKALLNELKNILSATEEKFRCYRGKRVLLMDISQNGLDIAYHAGFSSEGPGIVRKWLAALLKPSTRIDYVCLSSFRIWGAGSGNRIVTGHKYVDKPSPNLEEVWRRAGFPPIHQSFIH